MLVICISKISVIYSLFVMMIVRANCFARRQTKFPVLGIKLMSIESVDTKQRIPAGSISLDTLSISQHPELIKSHLKSRKNYSNLYSIVDEISDLRNRRNALIIERDAAKSKRKSLSQEIGALIKEKRISEVNDLKRTVEELNVLSSIADDKMKKVDNLIELKLLSLPNLLDDRVPEGNSDADNVIQYKWGEDMRKMGSGYLWHDEIATNLCGIMLESSSKISGTRFSVLTGNIARLERALIQYFLDFHTSRSYTEVSVPYIVSRSTLCGTGQLPKFEDDLFKVDHKVSNEDAFLIPTSEVPVTNLYRDHIIEDEELPIRHVCYSPCFRAEAGSHGRDTRGLLRQHQFHKVELVKIVRPESSHEEHNLMIQDVEEVLKSLELPFRRILLSSGDTGFSARICIDLEVWLPGQQSYREISSISNCYDFQSRRMAMRFRNKKKTISFPHTLNGSGVAVGRALVAILENHQMPDGSVKIPKCLQKYMGGMEFLMREKQP